MWWELLGDSWHTNALNSQNDLVMWGLLAPLFTPRKLRPERLSDSPKITQPKCNGTEFEHGALWCLPHHAILPPQQAKTCPSFAGLSFSFLGLSLKSADSERQVPSLLDWEYDQRFHCIESPDSSCMRQAVTLTPSSDKQLSLLSKTLLPMGAFGFSL